MTIELFILYNIVMLGAGWFLLNKHGEEEHEKGVLEAIQMHNEGRLTYTSYFNDEGIEMLDITVKPYED